jgi:hypothetical protein
MASTFSQLPGTLEIVFVKGDEVSIALDFDRDLTNYQITAPIYVTQVFASEGGGAGAVTGVGQVATSFVVSPVSLTSGTLTINLSETQTNSLLPTVQYRWYMRWVDPAQVTRTVLSGTLTVANP